jgi:hypothetical protein
VRTTVTIDSDTEALLREEVARSGLSFKEVLNRSVRKALGSNGATVRVEPLFVAPFPAQLPSFNRLADQWDDQDTVRELLS